MLLERKNGPAIQLGGAKVSVDMFCVFQRGVSTLTISPAFSPKKVMTFVSYLMNFPTCTCAIAGAVYPANFTGKRRCSTCASGAPNSFRTRTQSKVATLLNGLEDDSCAG